MSKTGLNVVICSRTQSEIDATVKEINELRKYTTHSIAKKGEVIGIKISEVDYLVNSTFEEFKSIHILVNNEGIVYILINEYI